MDYSKIKFRDGLSEPTNVEMNCIQFCVLSLAEELKIETKLVWPKVIYPLTWFNGQQNYLINSILSFLNLNRQVLRLHKLVLAPPLRDNTIVIYRSPSANFLHHAGVFKNNSLHHCLPGGVRTTHVNQIALFKRGCLGLEVCTIGQNI